MLPSVITAILVGPTTNNSSQYNMDSHAINYTPLRLHAREDKPADKPSVIQFLTAGTEFEPKPRTGGHVFINEGLSYGNT